MKKLCKIKHLSCTNYFPIFAFLIGTLLFAQPRPGEKKIDGVAAVIGDEIILLSDIQRDYMMAKQSGMEVGDECSFVGNTLLQKMVLVHAKSDTLVEVSNERVEARASQILEDFRSRGSDDDLLKVYGVNTISELEKELEILVRENQLIEAKKRMIEEGVDASPEDVRNFFTKYQSELPQINEEIELSHIIMYPEITAEHEAEILNQLNALKVEIENGASFATKATLISDDKSSATNGGLFENIKRGKFVPEFDAVAFNLDEGEISDPVKTEFGYHIIMLDKRLGQAINVRHILIQPEFTTQEIRTAKNTLDSIRTEIKKGNITFSDAAKKYSEDKYSRYNAGVLANPENGENRFERSKLDSDKIYAVAGLEVGDLTSPFETSFQRKKAIELIKINDVIPAHKVSLDKDYTRLKNYALQEKKQELLLKWVKQNLPDTFVKIDDDYKHCSFELNWEKN